MRYDLFDGDGHIYPVVFTGDINNPSYNWQDLLTAEQKDEIRRHMEGCRECTDRLSEEMLNDAWFASFMDELRERAKSHTKGEG